MSVFFSLIFIVSGFGIWFFWKKRPDKIKLIGSVVLLVLSAIIVSATSGSGDSSSHAKKQDENSSSTKKPTKLETAKTNVDALFANSKHTKLLDGTTKSGIESVKKEVNDLAKSDKQNQLKKDVLTAERLWPTFEQESIKKESEKVAKSTSESAAEVEKAASKSASYAAKKAAEESEIKATSESIARANSESKAKEAAEKAAEKNPDSYKSGITYDQVARNPDDYLGKKINFTGRVLQVMESGSKVQLRLGVDGNYDNVILVEANTSALNGGRVLEDDLVTAAGYSAGIMSYKSTIGGKISIPSMDAKIISDQGAASDDYGY